LGDQVVDLMSIQRRHRAKLRELGGAIIPERVL
jgi:hypothetical protein